MQISGVTFALFSTFLIKFIPVHSFFTNSFKSTSLAAQRRIVSAHMLNRMNTHSIADLLQPFTLLLGSGSATRKLILQENGVSFTVVKADIDEKAIGDRKNDDPKNLVKALALAKAEAIIHKLKSSNDMQQILKPTLLLTADQVVVHKGKILEKPKDVDEARSFINSYINDACSTVGSIALTRIDNIVDSTLKCRHQVVGVDTATIHFGSIPKEVIDAIIEEGEVLYCAGGLMVEHPLLQPYIEKLQGTQQSLMGLSPDLLHTLLCELILCEG